MAHWIFSLALAITAAGCVSDAQQAAIDGQRCQSYGFAAGSPGLAQCRMTLDTSRRQAMSEAAASFADGLQGVSDNYAYAAAHPVQPVYTPACAEGYSCPQY
jgi:hypothetical protein